MLPGLEGRRIAVYAAGTEAQRAASVVATLEKAGAHVHRLSSDDRDEDLHSTKYAALVLVGGAERQPSDPRVLQLVREFLVADKPLAVFGRALSLLIEAGGVSGRMVAGDDDLRWELQSAGATAADKPIHVDDALITARHDVSPEEFAQRVVRALADQLHEARVDEMSDLSFPASDPPATTPATIGRVPRVEDADSRP